MDSQLARAYDIYRMAADVRDELLSTVRDDDLAYRLPGNPSLGELLAEFAAVQQSYIDSFGTHKHDWSSVGGGAVLATTAALGERFGHLDADLTAQLDKLGEDDPEIDRGGWQLPASAQLHTLREALIITLGKAVVYLRALDRPLPERVREWVG